MIQPMFPPGTQKIIAVEGADDAGFFRFLLDDAISEKKVHLLVMDGESNLTRFLRRLQIEADFDKLEKIVIVMDSDVTLESVQSRVISELGVEFPIFNLNEEYGDLPAKAAGVLLLPDDESNGCLEDLLFDTIEKSKLKDAINDFLSKRAVKDNLKNKPRKARVAAYMAVKCPGYCKLHESFSICKCWQKEHFDDLRNRILEFL